VVWCLNCDLTLEQLYKSREFGFCSNSFEFLFIHIFLDTYPRRFLSACFLTFWHRDANSTPWKPVWHLFGALHLQFAWTVTSYDTLWTRFLWNVSVVTCSFCFSVIEEELFHLLFSLFDFMDCLIGTFVLCSSLAWLIAFVHWFFAKAHRLPKIQLSKNISPSELPVMPETFCLGSNQETPRR